jgi:N-acetylglucosaminyl-diphospho-decaprenol L-rhamnosyltransferase
MKNLVIVIVNWNTKSQLLDCLCSINHSDMNNYNLSQVVIVDNASVDESIALVKDSKFNFKLEIIENRDNKGFAVACNQGAQLAWASDYLLFLNPDTKLMKNTLDFCFDFLSHTNLNIGILGVKQNNFYGQTMATCHRFPTLVSSLFESTGLVRVFKKMGSQLSLSVHEYSCNVDHVMGCFFMMKRMVFDSLSGFDEQYFLYYEDLDFSYRAYKAGYVSYYLSNAEIYHKGGGSSEQVKDRRLFYSLRSSLIYAKKHFNVVSYWLILLSTLFVEPLARVLNCLITRKDRWANINATLRAYRLLYTWMFLKK